MSLKFGQIQPLVFMVTDGVMKKQCLHFFSAVFLPFLFISYLQVTMTCVRARTGSNFGLIGPPTAELAAHERLKYPHRLITGKRCLHICSTVLDRILVMLKGNDNIHESLDEFEIRLDRPLVSMVTDRVMMGKTVFPLFLGCFSSVPFHTCR